MPDEAVRTLETGLAFARHVAEGPFLINDLVGIAVANSMLERVDELIARPDAPNLYWALSTLPRPLIGVRESSENEIKLIEWMFPELDEVGRPRSEADWASLLGRFHRRIKSFYRQFPPASTQRGESVLDDTRLIKIEPELPA